MVQLAPFLLEIFSRSTFSTTNKSFCQVQVQVLDHFAKYFYVGSTNLKNETIS